MQEMRPRIAEALTSRAPAGRQGSGGGYSQSGEIVSMTMSMSHQLQVPNPPMQASLVALMQTCPQLAAYSGRLMHARSEHV